MIIPELTNFNLTKKIFIHEFKLLINNKKRNQDQIIQILENLKYFENKNPPYDICVNRIKELL